MLLLLALLLWTIPAAQIMTAASFEAEHPDINTYRLMVVRNNL